MDNKRFTVEPAVVDQFTDSFVGWFVRDNFSGLPVGDGKGGFIHVYGSRVGLAVDICEQMNTATNGITRDESAVNTPRDCEDSGLLAA